MNPTTARLGASAAGLALIGLTTFGAFTALSGEPAPTSEVVVETVTSPAAATPAENPGEEPADMVAGDPVMSALAADEAPTPAPIEAPQPVEPRDPEEMDEDDEDEDHDDD